MDVVPEHIVWVSNLSFILTNYMTLDKRLKFSEPQFFQLLNRNEDNINT